MKNYLQYLVILLDDTSVAYCHADNPLTKRRLMPLDTLRQAIRFGMKQNLMIQYVYPDYDLPEEYNEVIESIDHVKIGRDVRVYNGVPTHTEGKNIVLRLTLKDFIARVYDIALLLPQVARLNICLTDIEHFTDAQAEEYKKALDALAKVVAGQIIKQAHAIQANAKQANAIQHKDESKASDSVRTPSLRGQGESELGTIINLFDRLSLTEMHNCEAGVSNITIAPNGKFYLCPAFYYDEQTGVSNRMNHKTKDATRSVGDLENGLCIPNKQLLQLDHAPLCRICDAYHCHRCIWLNERLTWDANTPSHQQCVLAHIERNATRTLQQTLQEAGFHFPTEIPQIAYLDPFDVKQEW